MYGIYYEQIRHATAAGEISGERLDDTVNLSEIKRARLLEGEQSNSSVVLDRRQIIKFFRRRTDYLTPYYQIPKALKAQTTFANTPACLGAISYRRNGERLLLATISDFVENEGDCWTFFTQSLDDAIKTKTFSSTTLMNEIEYIGSTTAAMHNALSSLKGENFEPERISDSDVSGWVADLNDSIKTFQDYSFRRKGLPERASVLNSASRLLEGVETHNMTKMRIHGDYHLGQVLKSGTKYYVIDFEGEPMRSLSYRRQKKSPLKDVAGMIRSIQYAIASCTIESQDESLKCNAAEWADHGRHLLVESYLRHVDRGKGYLPEGKEEFLDLLDFFVLEKALYEFNYEANNRPSWVSIPLQTISQFAQRK